MWFTDLTVTDSNYVCLCELALGAFIHGKPTLPERKQFSSFGNFTPESAVSSSGKEFWSDLSFDFLSQEGAVVLIFLKIR